MDHPSSSDTVGRGDGDGSQGGRYEDGADKGSLDIDQKLYDEEDTNAAIFEDETIHQIKKNDSIITSLVLRWHKLLDDTVDWDKLGIFLGQNTHVAELTILGMAVVNDYDSSELEFYSDSEAGTFVRRNRPPHVSRGDNFDAFSKGLAQNTSIRHLVIRHFDLISERMLRSLSPFFENNHSLRCLTLKSTEMNSKNVKLLCSILLEHTATSLVQLNLKNLRLDDKQMGQIINTLNGHNYLLKVDLQCSIVGKVTMTALGQLLADPHSHLKEINLRRSGMNDETVAIMSLYLVNNKGLKLLLDLSENWCISATGWKPLCYVLKKPNLAVEKLYIMTSNINDEGLRYMSTTESLKLLDISGSSGIRRYGFDHISTLIRGSESLLESLNISSIQTLKEDGLVTIANALVSNTNLKFLSISDNPSIESNGWVSFFTILQNRCTSFESLIMSNNNINDEALMTLVDLISHGSTLKVLNLKGNGKITSVGWQSLPLLFYYSKSVLEKLYLGSSNIDDMTATDLASVLVNDTKLMTLDLENFRSSFTKITAVGQKAFSQMLCNESDIMATFNSNHTLQSMSQYSYANDRGPSEIASLLQLNEWINKADVARQKILKCHFLNGKVGVEKFVEMDSNILPQAISWIGRDNSGHTLLYQLLHGVAGVLGSSYETYAINVKRQRVS